MKTIITIIIFTSMTMAQAVHYIPFPEETNALQGNVIELSVENTSSIATEGIKIELTNAPTWLRFNSKEIVLSELKPKEEKSVDFVFFVEKNAEVNKEQTLNFTITEKLGQKWNKDIKIKILPPETFELYQNYPNPFNPTTAIGYILSVISNVNLTIYDIVGREVANLVNE